MRSSKSTCVRPGACSGRSQRCFGSISSGRTTFGSGRFALAMGLLERRILLGDEVHPPPQARRRLAVAGILGTLRLHAQPREQRPRPALRRCYIYRGGDPRGIDVRLSERDRQGGKARERALVALVRALAGEIVAVGDLLRPRAGAQRLERGAVVELQRRGANGAACELRPREEVRATGPLQVGFDFVEIPFRGGRIADQVIALEGLHRLRRVELPVEHLGAACTCALKNQGRCEKQAKNHGNLISLSRLNGHLRLISSMSEVTLRRLASTSERNAARSFVPDLALAATSCASASTLSTRFRLSRTSARIALAWLTARCVPSMTPPSPKTRWSALASTPSRRWATPPSCASSALARSIESSTFFASSSLPSAAERTPPLPARRSVTFFTLPRLACRLPELPVISSRFCSTLRSEATMRGISSEVSPRRTARSAPLGSGSSCRLPGNARMRAAPTMPRSSGQMLDFLSQRASLTGPRISSRGRPSSPRSMRLTRPIGKPAKVRSMPMLTPSAFSEIRVSFWVASNTPRAQSTYRTKPMPMNTVRPSSSPTRNCSFFGIGLSACSGGGIRRTLPPAK